MANESVAAAGIRLKRQGVRIKYKKPTKRNTKYPIWRLPFVTPKVGYWDMPKASGYGSGCDMGAAAADAFMKVLRAGETDGGGTLQNLVIDLLKSGVDAEDEGQKGQLVGFFSRLDRWLVASAKMLGSNLDKISEAEVEDAMTRAARETKEEYAERMNVWIKAHLELKPEAV